MAGQGGNGAEGRAPTTLTEVHGGEVADPLLGQTIDGRYQIDSLIGQGGMGMVYQGTHTSLGKRLAIKVLRAEVSRSPEIVERFRQEAQSASNIGNQHIIDVYDFGVLPDGSTYFVMEFLTGRSLAAALAKGPLSGPRTLHIVRQLCSALGAAHARGIVHRDIKPDNVQLVERDGDPDFVKVLDFGIAKVAGSKTKLTQAGQVFGTPHYMSPEQCAGSAVDHRTDVYAVGIMMYEMVTGQVPFDADNMMGILTKHLYEAPPSPRDLAPPKDVPSSLEAIILKCLQKKPDARYQSMAELLADVDKVDQGQTPAAVVERLSRNTRASGGPSETVDLRLSRSGLTFGVGQPHIPKRSKWPLVIGAAAFAAVVAVGVRMAVDNDVAATGGDAPHEAVPGDAAGTGGQPSEREGAQAQAMDNRVVVVSEPSGAQVLQQGVQVGTTPFEIPAGERPHPIELTIRQMGYVDGSITVQPEDASDRTVTLDKLPPAQRKPSRRASEQGGRNKGESQRDDRPAQPEPSESGAVVATPKPQSPSRTDDKPPAPKPSTKPAEDGKTAKKPTDSGKKNESNPTIRVPGSQVIGSWD